jgi:hypothetical protein
MSFVEFLQDDPLLTREQVMQTLSQVANELDMPDKRGACVIAGMTVSQEVGVNDNDPPFERRFWCPANHADEQSFNYPHDSISNDGRSVGYFQQQRGPQFQEWWGPVSSEMNLHSATVSFMTQLKALGYDASNAQAANDSAQAVQRSGAPQAYKQWWDDINGLYDKVAGSVPVPPPSPSSPSFFTEHNIIDGSGSRSRNGQRPRLFVLHTSEGTMEGIDLDNWMDGMGDRSYHYIVGNDWVAFDLVDTDLAAWSVEDANNFTINLVFAPSDYAWTRPEWLSNMGNGIKVAAYLCAQDCKKYGIPPVVRVGDSASGYQSLRNNDGVTDHYGINVGLGITNHTDVGKFFPWDVFNNYLQKFYNGLEEQDDMFTDEDRAMLQRVHFELTNKWNSRSIYAEPGEGPVDTLVGFELNEDGMEHAEMVERLAVLGDKDALRRVIRTAAGEGVVKDDATVKRANAVLAQVPEDVLKAYRDAVGVHRRRDRHPNGQSLAAEH